MLLVIRWSLYLVWTQQLVLDLSSSGSVASLQHMQNEAQTVTASAQWVKLSAAGYYWHHTRQLLRWAGRIYSFTYSINLNCMLLKENVPILLGQCRLDRDPWIKHRFNPGEPNVYYIDWNANSKQIQITVYREAHGLYLIVTVLNNIWNI